MYAVSRGDGEVGEDVTSTWSRRRRARGVGYAVSKVLGSRRGTSPGGFSAVSPGAATGAVCLKTRETPAGAVRMLNAEDNQMPLRF